MNQESTVPAVLTPLKPFDQARSPPGRPIYKALLACVVLVIVFLVLKR